MQKIITYCTNCGAPQGTFNNEEELRLKITELKKCEDCGAPFGFLSNWKIWNLGQRLISSEKPGENNTQDFWKIIHESIVGVAKKSLRMNTMLMQQNQLLRRLMKVLKICLRIKQEKSWMERAS